MSPSSCRTGPAPRRSFSPLLLSTALFAELPPTAGLHAPQHPPATTAASPVMGPKSALSFVVPRPLSLKSGPGLRHAPVPRSPTPIHLECSRALQLSFCPQRNPRRSPLDMHLSRLLLGHRLLP